MTEAHKLTMRRDAPSVGAVTVNEQAYRDYPAP